MGKMCAVLQQSTMEKADTSWQNQQARERYTLGSCVSSANHKLVKCANLFLTSVSL